MTVYDSYYNETRNATAGENAVAAGASGIFLFCFICGPCLLVVCLIACIYKCVKSDKKKEKKNATESHV